MTRPARKRRNTAVHQRPRPASAARRNTSPTWPPTIKAFFESGMGQITLGVIPYSSMHHTAVVNDGHTMLVALVRRPGETFRRFLTRLDRALSRALEKGIHVSEIG